MAMPFEYFCDVIERVLNLHQDKVKKLCYLIYDFNLDRLVCELDIYSFIKIYDQDNSDFFMSCYMQDII